MFFLSPELSYRDLTGYYKKSESGGPSYVDGVFAPQLILFCSILFSDRFALKFTICGELYLWIND